MSEKDTDEGLGYDFGSYGRHDAAEEADHAAQLVDRIVGDGNEVQVPSPHEAIAGGYRSVAEPPVVAVNRATMECLRGPCRHYWTVTARFHSQSDRINISRARQCNCHVEAMDLTEQNVFECDQWWPATLAFVPESLRPVLRPRLRKLWERWLKREGYDFSWRWWSDDVFEGDREEHRGHAVGKDAGPGSRAGNGKKDGLYFNM